MVKCSLKVFVFYWKQIRSLFCVLSVTLHSYCWYFVSSWNQTGTLHWKFILMFATVLLVPNTNEPWGTPLYFLSIAYGSEKGSKKKMEDTTWRGAAWFILLSNTLQELRFGNEIKKDERDDSRSMLGREQRHRQFYSENLKKIHHLIDLGVDEKIILKCILNTV